MENKKTIGIIGDLHLQENLGYSDLIEGGRKEEEQEILDFIASSLKDCDEIVLLGDNFNSKNNTSEVIKKFVVFLERFNDKRIYILSGNHEKHADGRTAIDFLREVNKPNWGIITEGVYEEDGMMFLPYMTKPELGADDDAQGTKALMKMIGKGADMLFVHHAISDSMSGVVSTNVFDEPVLPEKELGEKFDLVFGGHIHTPQSLPGDKIYVAGSIFNNTVGETQKYVWKIKDGKVEKIALPGRGIYKLENPSVKALQEISRDSILKVVMNDKDRRKDVPEIKAALESFTASTVLEQYKNERKKLHFKEGIMNIEVEELLGIYAKERKVDSKKLELAWNIIK